MLDMDAPNRKTSAIGDLGFFLTLQAIRRQLAAMPCSFYRVRLIDSATRRVRGG